MTHLLRRAFEASGYAITKIGAQTPQTEQRITPEHFYELFFSTATPDFFFVQIGAHDGHSDDPIHPFVMQYGLAGIAVEPQADVFARLEETYKDLPQVKCVNAAIGTGPLTFYTVKEEAKTDANFVKMTRSASFIKSSLVKSLVRKIPSMDEVDDYIVETPINVMSFEQLVEGVEHIDMLQIDAEGYDYEILKMVDFNRFSPKVINFESLHLSDSDRKQCEEMLTGMGYHFFRTKSDTTAYKV